MIYKVTLNGKVYEVEVEKGEAVIQAEYEAVLSWMYLNRLEGFTQEAEAAETGFIPDF